MTTPSKIASLPFETPIKDLDTQIANLEARTDAATMADEITALRKSREELLRKIYAGLDPVDVVKVARHPNRPQTADYINRICRDFRELHGDRRYRYHKTSVFAPVALSARCASGRRTGAELNPRISHMPRLALLDRGGASKRLRRGGAH